METIEQKLKRLSKESEMELKEMGLESQLNEVGIIDYSISLRAKKRLGQCCEKKHINISKWLLEIGTDTEIKNTIIHEILHTFKDTKSHGARWQYYARYVNNFGKYNIKTYADIDKLLKNKDINEENKQKMLGRRYEITCLKCGATYYKSRISDRVLNSYRKGTRYHTSCRGHDFRIIDLKTNKILVNGKRGN